MNSLTVKPNRSFWYRFPIFPHGLAVFATVSLVCMGLVAHPHGVCRRRLLQDIQMLKAILKLSKLKTYKSYCEDNKKNGILAKECSISNCRKEFKSMHQVWVTPCGHVFHVKCRKSVTDNRGARQHFQTNHTCPDPKCGHELISGEELALVHNLAKSIAKLGGLQDAVKTPPPLPKTVELQAPKSRIPPGWHSRVDPASGKTYYAKFNGAEWGETQWECPRALSMPHLERGKVDGPVGPDGPPPGFEILPELPSGWESRTGTGILHGDLRRYYYKTSDPKNTRTWTRPSMDKMTFAQPPGPPLIETPESLPAPSLPSRINSILQTNPKHPHSSAATSEPRKRSQ